MTLTHRIVRALSVFLIATCALAQGVEGHGGVYSHFAIDIWGGRVGLIPSPDGKKAISILLPRTLGSDQTHRVVVRAYGREYRTPIGAWVNAEAAWSPDSEAFFVTYSDGGNVGTYHVKVVYVTAAGIRIIEPIPNGTRLFVPTCFDPEFPNVAAIRWTRPDSSLLLIAVEVPPHSSCASMGTFKAFEIALPDGSVVARYGQIAAKKAFGRDLGDELRNAEDSCVERPETCIPPGLEASKTRR